MPIDLDDLEPLVSDAEDAFRRGGQTAEDGLDVSDGGLVQLRKSCRSLLGAHRLLDDGYYTLAIEAAFTSIEKTFMFWLIEERHQDPSQPPQSHTTAIQRSASVGFITEEVATRLGELWTDNRAQTYYQDGLPTAERAEALLALASEIHNRVISVVGLGYECLCKS